MLVKLLVKLLSKLPTSALIRLLLAERKLMSAAATLLKNQADKKFSDNRYSYKLHLATVAFCEAYNIQNPIEKPKFVQEIEDCLEAAEYYEGWIRKIDETIWQFEVADWLDAK